VTSTEYTALLSLHRGSRELASRTRLHKRTGDRLVLVERREHDSDMKTPAHQNHISTYPEFYIHANDVANRTRKPGEQLFF